MKYPETADQDAVTAWLQDREMKDHKLGQARSGRVRPVDVSTAIDRMREKAYTTFPDIDRTAIDAYVRDYVDPFKRVPLKPLSEVKGTSGIA